MPEYKCYTCLYSNTKSSNIKKHFAKKKPCDLHNKNIYTDIEISILNEAQFNKDMYKLIKANKIKDVFDNYKSNDPQHINLVNNIQNLDNNINNIIIDNNINNTIIDNNINNNGQIDTQNNLKISNEHNNNNITLNIENLVAFNKDWDTSHIDNFELFKIIANPLQFSNLHKSILDNINNNNIVLNNDGKSGLIYINNDNGTSSYKKEKTSNRLLPPGKFPP
jgi:hypothetical protein